MKKFYLSEHTLITQVNNKLILLYQSLLRKGVIAELNALTLIEQILSGKKTSSEQIKFADISCFSLSKCLLDNPAGIHTDKIPKLKSYSTDEFIKILVSLSIIVNNNNYIEKLGKRNGIFDKEHTGNFHQQIGSFLFSLKKLTPEEWWIYQKFKKDFSSPTNTPYLWVQEKFMREYFNEDMTGLDLLDFGCGIGYYSNFFRNLNATVLGVDPSEKYIQIANKIYAEDRLDFKVANFENPDDFISLKGQKFDRIFLCDVFLYYFVPYKKLNITPEILLLELKKLLKNDGLIYILDPHGAFHLQPWMGRKNPFLISCEYKNKKFRVTPTLEEISKAIEKAGMRICKIRELYSISDSKQENISRKITSEFPLWWFFEISK